MFRKEILMLLIGLASVASAQELPKGKFLADSLKLGEPVPYTLSYRYESIRDVIFPDSLFDFSPFELDHKIYFPTRTKNGISYDSAVYYLSYFELDTVQIYAMPVFEVLNGDSSRIRPLADTIYLQQVVAEVPDSVSVEGLPLKENTDYIRVPFAFNYPYLIIGIIVFIVLAILVAVLFGSTIRTAWKIFWLNRRHKKFLEQFDALIQQSSSDFRNRAEKTIVLWKKYLQQLEKFPYTSYTTRELVKEHPNEQLGRALHSIDSALYNPREQRLDDASFATLLEYAELRFEQKINKLKNGR